MRKIILLYLFWTNFLFPQNPFSMGSGDETLVWQWQNPIPAAVSIRDIYFTSQTTGWIAGMGGLISKTTDGGLSWTNQYAGTSSDFQTIFFHDSLTGWAGGTSGALVKTTNGGKSWINRSLPDAPIKKILFVNRTTGWISTGLSPKYPARLFGTTDAGKTWSIVTPDFNPGFLFTFTDELNGYAALVNIASAVINKTTDGGKTWSKVLESASVNFSYQSIYFKDKDVGWVYGYSSYRTYFSPVSYATTDGGKNWKEFKINNESVISVYFIDRNNGWAIGQKYLYSTSDNGNSWTIVAIMNPLQNGKYLFVNKTLVYNVTLGAEIYKSVDGGKSWTDLVKGPKENLRAVYFANSKTGCAAGDNGIILWTKDGGTNWIKYDSAISMTFYSVCLADDSTGWVCGSKGRIFKTTDSGKSWAEEITNFGEDIKSISFIDRSTGWAIGYSKYLLKTSDGGNSWTMINTGIYDLYESVNMVSKNTGWIAGSVGRVLLTTDGGLSWAQRDPHTQSYIRSSFFLDENNGWICGENGMVEKTGSGFTGYTPLNAGSTRSLMKIHFRDINNGILVGAQGSIYETSTGGTEWNLVKQTNDGYYSPVDIYGGFCLDSVNAWAVGTRGTIVKRNSVSFAWDKDTVNYNSNIPSGFKLLQNYPNPFNSVTRISFDIPENAFITLKIYDLLGRTVSTLVSENKNAGSYITSFNAAGLPSGIYFYRLEAQDFTDVKKIILLR